MFKTQPLTCPFDNNIRANCLFNNELKWTQRDLHLTDVILNKRSHQGWTIYTSPTEWTAIKISPFIRYTVGQSKEQDFALFLLSRRRALRGPRAAHVRVCAAGMWDPAGLHLALQQLHAGLQGARRRVQNDEQVRAISIKY